MISYSCVKEYYRTFFLHMNTLTKKRKNFTFSYKLKFSTSVQSSTMNLKKKIKKKKKFEIASGVVFRILLLACENIRLQASEAVECELEWCCQIGSFVGSLHKPHSKL
ncbi:LOW QUALITY PROTEIN: hypothetical protein PanWU01x14_313570 [Parasponia andersonii]|uniref:Uncharacterized protein n=1 Tax=Parasponia andersonii TaxID=3476 RepID=A0A2P5AP10_PARAD|nr:LOW QUALITY PROTEIN: hypothetical protein PanWU01x14_313570 [Parasponia andersonii]